MNEPPTAPDSRAAGEPARALQGLSSIEAAARLARDGPNLLPQPEQRAWWAIVLNILREPMLLMLLAAAAIYLLLGDPGEAAVLGASVLIVIAMTAYQEQKTERALQALRELEQSARAGIARRRTLPGGRPGRRRRRRRPRCRGRSRPGRCAGVRGVGPAGRRIDAHRRIGAGPSHGVVRRGWNRDCCMRAPWWSAAGARQRSWQSAHRPALAGSAPNWAASSPN